MEEIKRISLLDVLRHSKKKKIVSVMDGEFELTILPWTALQLEELAPILATLTKEFKDYISSTDGKESEQIQRNLWGAISTVLDKKELFDDVFSVVYTTIERGNQTVLLKNIIENGSPMEVPLFSRDDMKANLPLLDIKKIITAVWELNITENPSIASRVKEQIEELEAQTENMEDKKIAQEIGVIRQ